MSEGTDLQRLLTWLSPAFPVGAFAWSAGLESAIAAGTVQDRASRLTCTEATPGMRSSRDWNSRACARGTSMDTERLSSFSRMRPRM